MKRSLFVILSFSLISSLAFAEQNLKAGDAVISKWNTEGKVVTVFENNTALANMTDGQRTVQVMYNLDELSKRTTCHGAICKGAKVLTAWNSTGEVKRVYENGMIVVSVDVPGKQSVEGLYTSDTLFPERK